MQTQERIGTVNQTQLGANDVVIWDPKGQVRVYVVQPGILAGTFAGYVTKPFADTILTMASAEIRRQGSVLLFADTWALTSVSYDYAQFWTQWLETRLRMVHVKMLTRSKLVEMAVRVATMALGSDYVEVFARPETYAATGRSAAPTFERRPVPSFEALASGTATRASRT